MIANVNNFDIYALLGLKGEEKQKKQPAPTDNQTALAEREEPQKESKSIYKILWWNC